MSIYKYDGKTKDDRKYYFQVKVNGISHKSKKFSSFQEAREAESKFLLDKDKLSNKRFKVVAANFFDEIKKYRKLSTYQTYIDTYSKHIAPYFDEKNISSINIPFLKNYRENVLKMDYSTRYLNKINNVINLILDYANTNYGVPNLNKTLGAFQEKKDKVVKEKIRYMTYEEYQKFISVIDDITYKTFFMLLYLTGMRLGEVLALTFNDIKNDSIVVNKTLYTKIKGSYSITSTKNNVNRVIKMDKTLNEQLDSYIAYMKSYTDFSNNWFLFGGVRYLSPTTINRKKHQYFELSGVREITIHEFRHSHVSLLINQYIKSGNTDSGKFFLMMSQRMGHTIDVMQRTYMHLFPTTQDSIVDILNNL